MPFEDAWDWPLIVYVGTKILKMSEGKLWRTTPRKFQALLAVHAELNDSKDSENKKGNESHMGYIDQII
jgi:hypothetical protein